MKINRYYDSYIELNTVYAENCFFLRSIYTSDKHKTLFSTKLPIGSIQSFLSWNDSKLCVDATTNFIGIVPICIMI